MEVVSDGTSNPDGGASHEGICCQAKPLEEQVWVGSRGLKSCQCHGYQQTDLGRVLRSKSVRRPDMERN